MPTGIRYNPEQIFGKLREAMLEVTKRLMVSQSVDNLSFTERTHCPGGNNREVFETIKRSALKP